MSEELSQDASTSSEEVQEVSTNEQADSTEDRSWFKSDKYKTVEDQAKAYTELEKKFGAFVGKPEEYTLPEGIEADPDNPLFQKLGEIGSKYNMNNDMYTEIISMYNEVQSQQQEAFIAEQKAQLGDNGETRLKNINDWVKANVPESMRENVINWTQTAADVEALETFINMTKGQKIATPDMVTTTPEFTEEGLRKLMSETDDYGRRRVKVDPAFRKKVNEYRAQLVN